MKAPPAQEPATIGVSVESDSAPVPVTEEQLFLDALRKASIVPEDMLQGLLERAHHRGIEHQLLLEGVLTDVQIARLKAQINGWRFIDLQNTPVDFALLKMLPRSIAEAQRLVPFDLKENIVKIACLHPDRLQILRLIVKKSGFDVQPYLATEAAILTALSHYDHNLEQASKTILERHAVTVRDKTDDHSIIELVETMLLHAARQNASDIHIEPWQDECVVRERVDGILHRNLTFPKDVHNHVVARIKVLSNLAIDEHSAPQDGKLLFVTPEGQRIDVRVSTTPTTHGEKVVLRLLVSQGNAIPLESLGIVGEAQKIVEAEHRRAWGMILVTGPTGSGKTTTQYALMRRMNREDVNIATIEDPVEYDLPGVNQIQVNEKAGITFATGLRSIVRQDPNIILVGEIRDIETADIAINAAMTGHLVLSTIHTNDAATAIPRLLDMKVEPFIISSTVNLIIAQRLVRKICMRCRQSLAIEKMENRELVTELLGERIKNKKDVHLYHGKGCEVCHHTGYMGRLGIFEVMKIDDTIRGMIMKHANASEIRDAAVRNGMITMADDGLEKVLQGITTIEEVIRVIRS
ncbi:MAG: GspE/PulE family protein [Candidatus Peribacteraceae bacterium]|nr:GspE/PulE family protein [Candidatus Peribacteraceae bacterium]MDD5074545.1 GspE/PulE family protein [Candidatus Peribacteraceae bacterium]